MSRLSNFIVWGNLAYPAVGIGLGGLYLGDPIFAVMMSLMGLASAYYHAGGRFGNHLDVGMIYSLLSWLILLTIGVVPGGAIAPAFGTGLGLRWKLPRIRMESKVAVLMAALSGAILGTIAREALIESRLSSSAILAGALAVFGAALWIRSRGERGHAWWHLISAGGLGLLRLAVNPF